MRYVKKGEVACLIDYPRAGDIFETKVATSGNKFVTVEFFPYLKISAVTLQTIKGSGFLFIGSKQQYIIHKAEKLKRDRLINEIKTKLHILSTIQLNDIKYQINKMID